MALALAMLDNGFDSRTLHMIKVGDLVKLNTEYYKLFEKWFRDRIIPIDAIAVVIANEGLSLYKVQFTCYHMPLTFFSDEPRESA